MNSHFPAQAAPIKLYRNPKSGHCHRVELMMALLDLPYEPVDLDMKHGAHKEHAFLAMNPFGLVPFIDDNRIILSDSNAILVYLVRKYPEGHDWHPEAPETAAHVQRWLSIAAGEIAEGPAVARLVNVFGASLDHQVAKTKAHKLLAVMDTVLRQQSFLVGTAVTIADIACYSYIAHAPEGGVGLQDYPSVRAWLSRIETLPRFVGMVRSPVPEQE